MKRLTLCILVFVITMVIQAQTTTPAPTKTPQPSLSPEATFVSEGTPVTTLSEPYTQEDLSVLVGNVQRPNGIVWFNGNLYTACNGDFTLYQINAETGETITLVYGVRNAHTLYAEETDDGYDLFVPDFDTDQLVKVDQRRSAPQQLTETGLSGPWGIVRLNETSFLVTNVKSNTITQVTTEGIVQEIVRNLRAPAGIVIDDSMVYVVNNGSARRAIEWFSLSDLSSDSDVITKPLVSGLQNASGLVLGADGYLYFTYALGTRGVVGRINPSVCRDNGCTNEQVEIVLYTDLQAPLAGLAISPDMRLFVHTIYRPELYWIDLVQ